MNTQGVDNYYDLLLNQETSRYIFRIIAVKIIMENPTEYGFYLREKDLYPPVPLRKIEISESIPNIAEYAIEKGFNYRILKEFNPWLRTNKLSNPYKKTYQIYLPINKKALGYDFLQKDIHDDNSLYNDTICVDEI